MLLILDNQRFQDEPLMERALSFYRLMVVWLVRLVGGFKMPLPSTCPVEFASMPEHFVEDAMELLIFASRMPKAFHGILLVGFLSESSLPKYLFLLSLVSYSYTLSLMCLIYLFCRMNL